MVATFCLRLAFGMIASLLVVDPTPIPPRFFRIQFLATLGLLATACVFAMVDATGDGPPKVNFLRDQWMANSVIISFAVCFLGAIAWNLDRAPLGSILITAATLALGLVLFFVTPFAGTDANPSLDWWRVADHYASAAVLGTTTSAMLLGHSYLISPTMTISPLKRMLVAGMAALAFRVGLALCALWFWTAEHPLGNLDVETLLWLSARWLLGILAPLVLGWMAWETARIRSTQSATGILYVVVIVCFLGELTSLLLLEKTGSVL